MHPCAPKAESPSGIYQALTADTLEVIAIPGRVLGRNDTGASPVVADIYFVDGSGDEIEGRIGFSATNDLDGTGKSLETYADGDTSLGYHRINRNGMYGLPKWAKFVYLAAHVDAVAKGSWLYE